MKRNFPLMQSAIILSAAWGASTAWGWPDPVFGDGIPRIWCWNPRLGDGLTDARFVQTVDANSLHADCGGYFNCCDRTPEKMADITCTQIEAWELIDGRVGIRLGGVGGGNLPVAAPQQFFCDDQGCQIDPAACRIPALLAHEDDVIVFEFGDEFTYPTPWTWNGIDEVETWMIAYITEYEERQSNSKIGIPDPNRFLFDQEFDKEWFVIDAETLPLAIAYWEALQKDPRWDTIDVAGFRGGDSLYDIWMEAGEPTLTPISIKSWDPNVYGGSAGNGEWWTWWHNLLLQVSEGSQDEAMYGPIKAEWPNCKTSNYRESCKLDGQGNNFYIDAGHESSIGKKLWWIGRADFQQPVFYPASTSYMFDKFNLTSDTCIDPDWSPHEPVTETAMRLLRYNANACVFSFKGANKLAIMPVVTLPHEYFPIGGDDVGGVDYSPPIDNRASNDAIRRTLALAKSRGCTELFLWNMLHTDEPLSPQNDYNWDRFKAMVDQVWGFNVDTVSTIAGSSSETNAELLAYAHGDAWEVTASTSVGAGIEVVFTNAYGQTPYLRVDIELTANTDTDVQAFILKNDDQTTVAIDLNPAGGGTSMPPCDGEYVHYTGRIATASDFYHTGNKVKVRVVIGPDSTGFKATFDMVQVMADDNERRKKADINGDGTVDGVDDADFETLYAAATSKTPVFHPAADFNHDGVANSTDRSEWKACYADPCKCGYVDEVFPHNP